MKDYKVLQQTFMVNTYANRALTIVRGEGMYLYDDQGNAYLDVMSNYGVNIMGHNHPAITNALTEQLKKIVVLHNSFSNDVRAEAAMRLAKACGHGLTQVYFGNSGAEAIEAALKFAVMATGKRTFISCINGYHGKTLGALSATAEEKYQKTFRPLLWSFKHIAHDDVAALEKAIDDETAAFIVEPVQGEGGIHPPNKQYLQKVREICTKHNVLLIVDEIQTGGGRTGSLLASHAANIDYDMVCLGKGLAGGVPFGATLVSKAIGAKIMKGSHTSTFGGNPLACAGILAMLDLINDKQLEYIKEIGEYFKQKLQTLTSSLVAEVRGEGLMLGLEVTENRDKILQLLQKERILAIPAAENVVRFLPPFIIEKKHIDTVVQALQKVLDELVK